MLRARGAAFRAVPASPPPALVGSPSRPDPAPRNVRRRPGRRSSTRDPSGASLSRFVSRGNSASRLDAGPAARRHAAPDELERCPKRRRVGYRPSGRLAPPAHVAAVLHVAGVSAQHGRRRPDPWFDEHAAAVGDHGARWHGQKSWRMARRSCVPVSDGTMIRRSVQRGSAASSLPASWKAAVNLPCCRYGNAAGLQSPSG